MESSHVYVDQAAFRPPNCTGWWWGCFNFKYVFHAIYSAAPIQKWIVASRALFLSHARLCEVVGVAYSYMHSLLFEYVTHVRIMMHVD